jgi:hypothetical protein
MRDNINIELSNLYVKDSRYVVVVYHWIINLETRQDDTTRV